MMGGHTDTSPSGPPLLQLWAGGRSHFSLLSGPSLTPGGPVPDPEPILQSYKDCFGVWEYITMDIYWIISYFREILFCEYEIFENDLNKVNTLVEVSLGI